MYDEIYSFKHIFKLGGCLGTFPLETNSFIKYVHLIFYLTFNLVGLICTPIEFINIARRFEMKIQEMFIFGLTQIVLGLVNILFIYGIFKNRESWKQLSDILEKLSTDIFANVNSVQKRFKIYFFMVLQLFIQLIYTHFLINPTTFADIMSFSLWIWTYLKCFTLTVTIWKISKILTLFYSCINDLIKKVFSDKKFNTMCFSIKILQIQRTLYLLNNAVILVNNIMGKTLFIMIISPFLSNLSFINFTIFIFESNKSSEIFVISTTSLLFSLELFVSKHHFFFFYYYKVFYLFQTVSS